MRMQTAATLLIATRNLHKVGEIQALLGDHCKCMTLRDFPGALEVVEDGLTFASNATKKAVTLARWLAGLPREKRMADFVLADDSGLEVDALNLAPGVHSARFAAMDTGTPGNSPDKENNAKLLRLLGEVPENARTARFRCVIALTPVLEEHSLASPACEADPWELGTELFNGVCEGRMAFEPRGSNGFGYDPLFIPLGFDQSFAELGDATKNSLSHRAKALEGVKAHLAKAGQFV